MSLPRFFLEGAMSEDGVVPLSGSDRHHVADVLRMRTGEHVVVVEPGGLAYELSLDDVSRHEVTGSVVAVLPSATGPSVTLFQGLPKASKMDDVVEKAVEIGVDAIVPFESERAVVRLDDRKREQRRERWQRIALAAAKQSQRGHVPEIGAFCDVESLVDAMPRYDRTVVFWEDESDTTLPDVLADIGADASVAVVVGPEGGLSAAEVSRLRDSGARVATLGDTILRTETAGIVGLALVLHNLGGLGGAPRAR